MRSHPCVILKHHDPRGSHFDWLMPMPTNPDGLLWASRIRVSPRHFASVGRFEVHRLPDHRRVYMSYQGGIDGGRGHVVRIDRGRFIARQWTLGWCVIDLRLQLFQGTLVLKRICDDLWHGRVDRVSGQGGSLRG